MRGEGRIASTFYEVGEVLKVGFFVGAGGGGGSGFGWGREGGGSHFVGEERGEKVVVWGDLGEDRGGGMVGGLGSL